MIDAKKMLKIVLMVFLVLIISRAFAQPSGADIIYNSTETKTPAPAQYLNTSGGTFTTLILSGESQNLKWKAYAGNVTGALVLDDADDFSIYQWQTASFTGEVYASRNDSIDWGSIECANQTHIYDEDTDMNHTSSSIDSVNNTFQYETHRSFSVGTIPIDASSCRSTFTWVNDTAQTPSEDAVFQEVLLYDDSDIVYTTFIDDSTQGFNNKTYDFQMIVPEKGVSGEPATPYYFYLELA